PPRTGRCRAQGQSRRRGAATVCLSPCPPARRVQSDRVLPPPRAAGPCEGRQGVAAACRSQRQPAPQPQSESDFPPPLSAGRGPRRQGTAAACRSRHLRVRKAQTPPVPRNHCSLAHPESSLDRRSPPQSPAPSNPAEDVGRRIAPAPARPESEQ